jgi:hypothetical protein
LNFGLLSICFFFAGSLEGMEQIVTVLVSQMAGMENVNMDQEKNMGLLYLERLTAFRLVA